MATNPKSDPIEEEGVRILDENPALRARLREFGRKLKDGEDLEVHEHDEARRIVGLGPVGAPDPSSD